MPKGVTFLVTVYYIVCSGDTIFISVGHKFPLVCSW